MTKTGNTQDARQRDQKFLARDRACEIFTVLKSKAFRSGAILYQNSRKVYRVQFKFSHAADLQAVMVTFLHVLIKKFHFFYTYSATPDTKDFMIQNHFRERCMNLLPVSVKSNFGPFQYVHGLSVKTLSHYFLLFIIHRGY